MRLYSALNSLFLKEADFHSSFKELKTSFALLSLYPFPPEEFDLSIESWISLVVSLEPSKDSTQVQLSVVSSLAVSLEPNTKQK